LGGAAVAVSVGVAWLDLTSFEQHVSFSSVGGVAATVAVYLIGGVGRGVATPVRLTPGRVRARLRNQGIHVASAR
jgi:iron complex transport system permease protein